MFEEGTICGVCYECQGLQDTTFEKRRVNMGRIDAVQQGLRTLRVKDWYRIAMDWNKLLMNRCCTEPAL